MIIFLFYVISREIFSLLKATENGASTSGSSSKAATNKGDTKTNTTTPKKTYAIFDMAKRPKRARRDVNYAELDVSFVLLCYNLLFCVISQEFFYPFKGRRNIKPRKGKTTPD